MGSTLDAFTEKIAQPFDDAAPVVRNIANLYEGSNRNLKQHQTTLTATFSGLGANAFIDMINKQVKWVDGIVERLRELAGFYETCARDIRQAASYISGAIAPFLDIEQWVLDRLTPHIVAEHGESAIHAVFNDMRGQLNREMHDASGFFSDLVHGHFGAALHDAEDSVKGIAHLGGDVLAMVSSVESLLSQWAADIYSAVNRAMNKLNSWGLDVEDWLFGLSDIADETVIFTDPNSTSAEKWAAGIEMGVNIVLDIGMIIPGADVFALGSKGAIKLLEKFGLKELVDGIVKKAVARVTENIAAQVVKKMINKFEQKLAQKFSQILIQRMLKRKLTQTVFGNLQDKVAQALFPRVQKIIDDYLAGKISKEEAQALLKKLLQNTDPLHSGGRAGIGGSWASKFPGLNFDQLEKRVEQIRQELLKSNDIGKVQQTLENAGINIDRDTLQAIKNYNFNGRGLAFTFENYAAWKRIVAGKATVDDLRYLLHEKAEVDALRKIQQHTGFDFMGRSWESMTRRERQQWLSDFNRHYMQAHSEALGKEYDFLARSVGDITQGKIKISPLVAAAIDPTRAEARKYMLVGGKPLEENPAFKAWEHQGDQVITLGRAASEKLGLAPGTKITLRDLLGRLKQSPSSILK